MLVLLKCVSLATIITSFVFLILHFTRKLKLVEKPANTLQVSIILKLLLIVSVIFALLGTIIMFNLQEKKSIPIRSMSDSLNETNSILIEPIYYSHHIDIIIWMIGKNATLFRLTLLATEFSSLLTDGFGKCDINLYFTIHRVKMQSMRFKNLKNSLTNWDKKCTTGIDGYVAETEKNVEELTSIKTKLKERFDEFQLSFQNTIVGLEERVRSQKEEDLEDSEIRSRLSTVNNMFNHFISNINRSETTRSELKKQVEQSFTRPKTIKIFVNITIGFMLLFSLVTVIDVLISISRFIGHNIWSTVVISMFFLIIFMTFIHCSMIALISFEILGQFDCRFNGNNSGLPDFMPIFSENSSPLIENKPVSLCAEQNTTFFSVLSTEPWINNQSITKKLQLEKYKEIQLIVLTQPHLLKKMDSSLIESQLKIIEALCENLFKLHGAASCLGNHSRSIILDNRKELQKAIDDLNEYKVRIEGFNHKMTIARTLLDSIIDKYDVDMVKGLMSYYSLILKRIKMADFQCDPIIKEFSKIGQDICEEVYIPLEDSWIFLLLTMILCSSCLFMHILIYRCKLGEKKDQASEIMKSANSTSSTSLPNKTISKNDGQIVTTPA